jgi:hypothetical protein
MGCQSCLGLGLHLPGMTKRKLRGVLLAPGLAVYSSATVPTRDPSGDSEAVSSPKFVHNLAHSIDAQEED